MKKILSVSVLLLMGLFLLPGLSFGQAATTSFADISSPQDLIDRVTVIANWILIALLAVALVFVLLAALQFVTAGGDPTAVAQARQKLVYAAIGIIVGVLAKGIVEVVKQIAQGT